MEPFKTFAFNVRTKEGIKLDVKPPHDEKDYDYIKIDNIKMERVPNEPYTIKVLSDTEYECNRSEDGKGIICSKPKEQKSLFSKF